MDTATPKVTYILIRPIYTKLFFILISLGLTSTVLLPGFAWISIRRDSSTTITTADRASLVMGRLLETVDWATDLALLRFRLQLQPSDVKVALIVAMCTSLVAVSAVNVFRCTRAIQNFQRHEPGAWKNLCLHLPLASAFAVIVLDETTLSGQRRVNALYGLAYRVVEDIPQIGIAAALLFTRPMEADLSAFLSLVLSVESLLMSCATINGDLQSVGVPSPVVRRVSGAVRKVDQNSQQALHHHHHHHNYSHHSQHTQASLPGVPDGM